MVSLVNNRIDLHPLFPSRSLHNLPETGCAGWRYHVVEFALCRHKIFEVIGDTVFLKYLFNHGEIPVCLLDYQNR